VQKILSTSLAVGITLLGSVFGGASQPVEAAKLPIQLEAPRQSDPTPGLYKVKVEHGTRCTASGTMQAYTLYIPEGDESLPQGPYPTAMLIHGFLMTGEQHRNNAMNLAEHGFIVVTPNISKWLWGDDKRMRNVADLTDCLAWMTGRTGQLPDSIKGKVDDTRIGIAGNSSGGAVALELALAAQAKNIPVHACVSLDGVPWDRTADRVKDILPFKLLTLRAEPCLCNYHARMLRFLDQLSFPFDDVKVNGAHHCDLENPTTLGCYSVCGKSDNQHRMVFQNLLYLYLRDALAAQRIGVETKSFVAVVKDMESKKEVEARTDVHGHAFISAEPTSEISASEAIKSTQ
jgi:pimeloyl-ACP methyl ester carboxylesterase